MLTNDNFYIILNNKRLDTAHYFIESLPTSGCLLVCLTTWETWGKMILAHKIRLYPTREQETLLNKSCGVARFAYNWALEEWCRQYKEGGKPTMYKIDKQFNAIKKEHFPFVLEVSKCCAQCSIHNLGKAFSSFLSKKSKYPSFHKKGQKDSFTLANDQFYIVGKRVHLARVGKVKTAELLRFSGKIMSGTVSKKADKWFLSVSVDTDIKSYKKTGKSVGIDLGVKDLLTTSDNEKFANPHWLNRAEKKLKKYQRILARRMKGSKRREKVRLRLARQHLKVSNQRNDYTHKITSYLVKKYDTICMEDLNVRGMVKNHNLAKAISNVSFGEITRQLKYKCNLYGKSLLQVDRFYPSSKTCSVCGCVQDKMPLHIREWTCPDCGAKHDRDLNAAINILRQAMSEVTHVERKALVMFSDITQLDSLNRECCWLINKDGE